MSSAARSASREPGKAAIRHSLALATSEVRSPRRQTKVALVHLVTWQAQRLTDVLDVRIGDHIEVVLPRRARQSLCCRRLRNPRERDGWNILAVAYCHAPCKWNYLENGGK